MLFKKINNHAETMILVVSGLIMLRGLIVLMFSWAIDYKYIYVCSFIFTMILSAYGAIHLRFNYKTSINEKFILVSAVYLLIWTVFEVNQKNIIDILRTVALIGFTPFMIYAFMKIDKEKIIKILILVTIVNSLALHIENYLINYAPTNIGLTLATKIQSLIRYDVVNWSKSNNIYRTVGLFGFVPHYSGITMAMLTTFWGSKIMCDSNINFKYIFLLLICCSAMLTTLSAISISATIICLFLLLVIKQINLLRLVRRNWIMNTILIFVISGVILLLVAGIKNIFLENIYNVQTYNQGEIGDQYGTTNKEEKQNSYDNEKNFPSALYYFYHTFFGSVNTLIKAYIYRINIYSGDYANLFDFRFGREAVYFHNVVFGHLDSENMGLASVEIPLFRFIFIYGLIGTVLICAVLIFPMLRFFYKGCVCSKDTPFVFASFCGFLTLLHYDYIFSTSVVLLFWIFYAKSGFKGFQ
jgi:hypothetical protein